MYVYKKNVIDLSNTKHYRKNTFLNDTFLERQTNKKLWEISYGT